MAKQLKQFKSIGIEPAKVTINYFVTITLYEWWDKVNGNTYSAAKVSCNGVNIAGYSMSNNNAYNLLCQIQKEYGLTNWSQDMRQQGIEVTVTRHDLKYRDIKVIKEFRGG